MSNSNSNNKSNDNISPKYIQNGDCLCRSYKSEDGHDHDIEYALCILLHKGKEYSHLVDADMIDHIRCVPNSELRVVEDITNRNIESNQQENIQALWNFQEETKCHRRAKKMNYTTVYYPCKSVSCKKTNKSSNTVQVVYTDPSHDDEAFQLDKQCTFSFSKKNQRNILTVPTVMTPIAINNDGSIPNGDKHSYKIPNIWQIKHENTHNNSQNGNNVKKQKNSANQKHKKQQSRQGKHENNNDNVSDIDDIDIDMDAKESKCNANDNDDNTMNILKSALKHLDEINNDVAKVPNKINSIGNLDEYIDIKAQVGQFYVQKIAQLESIAQDVQQSHESARLFHQTKQNKFECWKNELTQQLRAVELQRQDLMKQVETFESALNIFLEQYKTQENQIQSVDNKIKTLQQECIGDEQASDILLSNKRNGILSNWQSWDLSQIKSFMKLAISECDISDNNKSKYQSKIAALQTIIGDTVEFRFKTLMFGLQFILSIEEENQNDLKMIQTFVDKSIGSQSNITHQFNYSVHSG